MAGRPSIPCGGFPWFESYRRLRNCAPFLQEREREDSACGWRRPASWNRYPRRCRARMLSVCARVVLLVTLAMVGLLAPNRESAASPVLPAPPATADAGLAACTNNRGKALYDCVANVLDRLSGDIARVGATDTRSALQTAAARLRS